MNTTTRNVLRPTPSLLATMLVALGCLLSEGTALAAATPEIMTKTVSYADLDLNSARGVKVLYARLNGAADQVCYLMDSAELARHRAYRNCVQGALARAVEQIDLPLLTALHNATRANAG